MVVGISGGSIPFPYGAGKTKPLRQLLVSPGILVRFFETFLVSGLDGTSRLLLSMTTVLAPYDVPFLYHVYPFDGKTRKRKFF